MPENTQTIAIIAPIPNDGQWITSLDDLGVVFNDDSNLSVLALFSLCNPSVFLSSFRKKLGTLSFEEGSESGFMSAIKNHVDLGLYNIFKKSKCISIYNVCAVDR
jgi:hypothetical protein